MSRWHVTTEDKYTALEVLGVWERGQLARISAIDCYQLTLSQFYPELGEYIELEAGLAVEKLLALQSSSVEWITCPRVSGKLGELEGGI